jgi:thiamine-phosphate pyrophosphorylase
LARRQKHYNQKKIKGTNMKKTYTRILDANLNRVSEGIRVIEDIFRFGYENSTMTDTLRQIRHRVRDISQMQTSLLLNSRQVDFDPGIAISKRSHLDQRNKQSDILHANFKRIQEGLRVIEESFKSLDKYDIAKQYEQIRFQTYSIEKQCYLEESGSIKKMFPATDIYCLTASSLSCGRSNLTVVKEMIQAGIKIIQYREKEKPFDEKYQECLKIRAMTKSKDVTFIVNDHVDLALMTQADGVHIGQTDYPIEAVRALTGNNFIIGVSTHSPQQALRAQEAGADYIGVGPIYSTKTKKDVCDPVGHAYLEFAVKNMKIPFVTIGGIKEHNIHDVVRLGATCVGIVSEITGADNIGEKIQAIRTKIKDCQNETL